MKSTINFGKIDAYGIGRRINEAVLELELKEENDRAVFTICGEVWNAKHTDIIMGGQCLDSMLKYFKKNKDFMEIYRLWNIYHLNDMHAGTIEQDNAIEEWKNEGNYYDFTEVCEYLKSVGLYEVQHEEKPYRYGSAWLYRAIPENDLQVIKDIMKKY